MVKRVSLDPSEAEKKLLDEIVYLLYRILLSYVEVALIGYTLFPNKNSDPALF